MIKSALTFLSGLSVAIIGFAAFSSEQTTKPELPQMLSFSATPRFENHIEIFGQKVDLSRWDLHERYERELTSFCFSHNNTLLTLKRANRLFPIICPILKEEGVPEDLIYLCCIESTLNTRAKSPAKAAGLWQFMESTGKEYGLQIDAEVDERYHTEKATRAACAFFKKMYAEFGDWNSVAAGFNGGINGIRRKLEKQKASTALDLQLVEETSRYMFRIMAMKEIMRDPYHYGFVLYSDQLYRPISTKSIKVSSTISDLTAWAEKQGYNYLQLKEFNPWLRDTKLTVRPGKEYQILLPNKDEMNYDGKPFAIYNIKWVVDQQ
ncbi:MAG: lytic transglycosylase domain-containing protein [Bacteroidales bacterium]|nr:lytic transglycosylase domain-containing protein [Bacteroidales bacterium]